MCQALVPFPYNLIQKAVKGSIDNRTECSFDDIPVYIVSIIVNGTLDAEPNIEIIAVVCVMYMVRFDMYRS